MGWLPCFSPGGALSPPQQNAQGEIPVSQSCGELRQICVVWSLLWSLTTGSRNSSGTLHITQQGLTMFAFHTTLEIMLGHTTGRGGFPSIPISASPVQQPDKRSHWVYGQWDRASDIAWGCQCFPTEDTQLPPQRVISFLLPP